MSILGDWKPDFEVRRGSLTGGVMIWDGRDCRVPLSLIADILNAIPALEAELNAWKDDCQQHTMNELFYMGLLDDVAKHLGLSVYVSEDGSIQQDPIRLKIPEMVAALEAERDKYKQSAEGWERDALVYAQNAYKYKAERDALKAENEKLQAASQTLLTAYRLGTHKGVEKASDTIAALARIPREAGEEAVTTPPTVQAFENVQLMIDRAIAKHKAEDHECPHCGQEVKG